MPCNLVLSAKFRYPLPSLAISLSRFSSSARATTTQESPPGTGFSPVMPEQLAISEV
jgi:hypothetical protein